MPKPDESQPLQYTTSLCDHYLIRKHIAKNINYYLIRNINYNNYDSGEHYLEKSREQYPTGNLSLVVYQGDHLPCCPVCQSQPVLSQ